MAGSNGAVWVLQFSVWGYHPPLARVPRKVSLMRYPLHSSRYTLLNIFGSVFTTIMVRPPTSATFAISPVKRRPSLRVPSKYIPGTGERIAFIFVSFFLGVSFRSATILQIGIGNFNRKKLVSAKPDSFVHDPPPMHVIGIRFFVQNHLAKIGNQFTLENIGIHFSILRVSFRSAIVIP